ncbi:MAG TPA: type I-C CRISPR-associated protein Cas8c/Csd1, partial [Fimbriimonadaceae bacterium]|nr:type I-C CRISPR-associated protein Cas8c/Csd1 [Fimbriimonadaceae bacterium]
DEEGESKEMARRSTLIKMLTEAASASPQLGPIARQLESQRQAALKRVASMKPAPKRTDLATVRIGSSFPVEDSSWHAWWNSFRTSLADGGKPKGRMVSFATGELIDPENTHPKLTKLSGVGLSQPFAPIITFDKPAFESYGLRQGANAAMDAEQAKAYVTALDDLLERSVVYSWKRPKPRQPKQLAKDFARLGGARILYWYSGPAEAVKLVEDELDILGLSIGSVPRREKPPEDDAEERLLVESRLRDAIRRIKTGDPAIPVRDVQFHLIALSGAGGRVMTRDYFQSTLLNMAEATEQWFADLTLPTYGGGRPQDPKLEQMLTCPLRPKGDQDYLKWVTPAGAWRQQLWRAALLGGRIPESAAAKALLAFNSTVVSGDLTDKDQGPQMRAHARRRLALVKAYLIRNRGRNMQPALDSEHDSAAYHCGRLLAVYDNLQRAALGDVGAGVIQRYYGGAMTNPVGVYAQLSRLAQTHLSKLGGGLANLYEDRIAEIHNGIRRQGNRHACYPPALSLDEQAMFALGFWHQTAHDNAERARNSAAKKARESAQDAQPEEEETQ